MSLKHFRWLHRWGFSRKKMRGGRLHRWLGDSFFHKELWLFEKESVARALFLGCLIGCSPLIGAHVFISCFLAIPFRANLPLTFALQWMTNPFTIPLYYPAAFLLGCRVLGFRPEGFGSWRETLMEITRFHFGGLAVEMGELGKIIAALFTGCLLVGLILGLTGYAATHLFWRKKRE
jgi:uncharacterized protein